MSGSFWVVLLMTTVIIFLFIFGWMAVIEIRAVHTLGVRVENSLIAAGWTGFSELDLMKMSSRINIDDVNNREVYLNKSKAIEVVEKYIKENLGLDEGLRATPDSYIVNKIQPIKIEEITVYNPDDLPSTNSDGVLLERTSIHLVVRIPKDIKFYGLAWLRKSVVVDMDSFKQEGEIQN